MSVTMFGCESRAAASASRNSRSSRASREPVADQLQSHPAAELRVTRLVHDAEAASPDLTHDLEAVEHLAGT
jgi:hypothetical protein